jgi:uncharacterized Rmd1/YagE family protein
MQGKFVKMMDNLLDRHSLMIEWIILMVVLVGWVMILELLTASAAAAQ